jgi:hypothetical protein
VGLDFIPCTIYLNGNYTTSGRIANSTELTTSSSSSSSSSISCNSSSSSSSSSTLLWTDQRQKNLAINSTFNQLQDFLLLRQLCRWIPSIIHLNELTGLYLSIYLSLYIFINLSFYLSIYL